eukprot:scaffold341937_cov27-Attheya_sp.AAC.1
MSLLGCFHPLQSLMEEEVVQLELLRLVYFVHAVARVELLSAQKYQLTFLGRLHGVRCSRLVPL